MTSCVFVQDCGPENTDTWLLIYLCQISENFDIDVTHFLGSDFAKLFYTSDTAFTNNISIFADTEKILNTKVRLTLIFSIVCSVQNIDNIDTQFEYNIIIISVCW